MSPSILASFLRAIPQSNQEAVAIHDLADVEKVDILLGYAYLLRTIGIVELLDDNAIRATSQAAKYTLMSIASYVENDLRLVSDWKKRGVYPDGAGILQNGATFLYELERRRLQLMESPPPSRVEEVVQVLVKRLNPVTGTPEILMQYDDSARQYQLIGGRRSPNDESLLQTTIREIGEEIVNELIYKVHYDLKCIITDLVVPATLSPTFGALTEYHFTVYHMTNLTQEIALQNEDAWITVDDILNPRQSSTEINELYQQIDKALAGGIVALADSFSI